MKKLISVLFASTLLVSQPSYALFGLFGSDDSAEKESIASQVLGTSQASTGLVNLLTEQLGVSQTQAAGGAGALLAMASSSLSGSSASELSDLSPNLSSLINSAKLLGGSLDSMSAVSGVFEKLGLDAAMISQFVPIITSYLGDQGASSGLLSALTGLWK